MPNSWVLKFPQSDNEGYLLIQASSHGDNALDLDFLATEGEAPYKGKIRQRKIAELRSKNFHGSDDEWRNILLHALNPQSAPALPSEPGKSLEIVAAVGQGTATIALRHRIDRIAQRLGSFELLQDDDAEIQLFDWCGKAVDQKTSLEAERDELRKCNDTAHSTIATLEAKLEDLVKAKAEHEGDLISKFVLLLNEKRLKIRNQQRLLRAANIEPDKLKEMEKTLEGRDRTAKSSRGGKRRADTTIDRSDEEGASSDAFEKMDVDAAEDERSSGRDTTPETETETDSESAGPTFQPGTGATKSDDAKNPTREPSRGSGTKGNPSPPPIRQLPFKRKGPGGQKIPEQPPPEQAQTHVSRPQAATKATAKADADDKETSSGDDEL